MSERIYVDIDDVLGCTIEGLIDLLEATHGRRVEVDAVRHFDLAKSFELAEDEISSFMERAHDDAVLDRIAPREGAADVLSGWADDGHSVRLVTGRPPHTNAASQRWLERHGFAHDALHHLDKWARPSWNASGLPAIGFDDLHEIGFAFAVEDSLDTAVRLVEILDAEIALMDRPWNRDVSHLSPGLRERLVRCADWEDIALVFRKRS